MEQTTNSKYEKTVRNRPKRIRKRPRSERNSNEDIQVQSTIVPLMMGGKVVPNTPLIRVVYPYRYTFTSYAKARWVGRTVLDIYTTEFGSYPASYYETAIQQGRILVSDEKVDTTYQIQGKDILMHTVHRHEPVVAVLSTESPYVHIIHETDDLIAIDKPSAIPIHPCGGYHNNSLMNLLEKEFGKKLYTIHRLDRLTSGLLVLAKSSNAAKEWGKAIQNRDCEKLYLARVKGRFPNNLPNNLPRLSEPVPFGEYTTNGSSENIRSNNAHGYWITDSNGIVTSMSTIDFSTSLNSIDDCLKVLESSNSSNEDNDQNENISSSLHWFHLVCPVRIEQPKIGVCSSGLFENLDDETYMKTVKSSHTSLATIHYYEEDDSTLLLVKPWTGRTHQIRISLQYIGHSIVNDPNYGGEMWYGNPEGKYACEQAEKILKNECNGESLVTTDIPATEREVQNNVVVNQQHDNESLDEFIQRTCVWCARRSTGHSVIERCTLEFLVRSPGLWLHALQYKVNGLSFRTKIPSWCEMNNRVMVTFPNEK